MIRQRYLLLFTVLAGMFVTVGNGAVPNIRLSIEPSGGLRDSAFVATITAADPRAEIRYTLDGREPNQNDASLYTNPISINKTTLLRATAFSSGDAPNPFVTRTYIFPREIINQTGDGFPKIWGTNLGQAVTADYAMDPEITQAAAYRDEMIAALRTLPSLSLVLQLPDLFDPAHGIYANPKETGADWERPASLELLGTNAATFQIACGLRIQGGWNRRPEESPKHSFRIIFKRKYGAGKLRFPLFEGDGPREFDELILRSGCNNSWLHWNGEERRRGELLRDQWMRETMIAMGHPSPRGRFVHLYLNGLYWGIYNLTERPSAPFIAWHEGGKPEHFDVRNADDVIQGDSTAWQHLMTLVNAGVAGTKEYEAVRDLVDLPQLVDFLIVNFYGANADWDRASNWYAARRRQPPGPFRFYVWDGERTLEGIDDNTMAFDDDQSPPRLFHKLIENAAFRQLFAERARQHLTGTGALTPAPAAERYRQWSALLDTPIIGESARWGDYRRDVHRYKTGPYELYTRNDHWRPEVARLLNDYFPKRTAVVIAQFQKAGLFAPTPGRD